MKDLREYAKENPKNTLYFLAGSHQYGLNTKESDMDYVHLVLDFSDIVAPFKTLPESKQYDNNDVKYYTFPYFVELLKKGNPNLTELVNEAPRGYVASKAQMFMVDYMAGVVPFLGNQSVAAAYFGHLNSVVGGEIGKTEITPKRASHFYRVAKSVQYLLIEKKLPVFRDLPAKARALEIKMSLDTLHPDEMKALQQETQEMYKELKDTLPGTEALVEYSNEYFIKNFALSKRWKK